MRILYKLYPKLFDKNCNVREISRIITILNGVTSPIVLKFSSFTNMPLTVTTRWVQFLKDYALNGFKQNMYHQDFYKFFENWAKIPTTTVIFPLLKSLPGPVRDYMITVTVAIILKGSFLTVLKNFSLQKCFFFLFQCVRQSRDLLILRFLLS